MQKSYTTKLFYGKFPYKILLCRTDSLANINKTHDWNIHNSQHFLRENNIHHRMYNQVQYSGQNKTRAIINSCLYLEKKEDFDTCCQLWQNWISAITVPFRDEHVDILKARTEVIVRPTLLFKKYRYIVVFKRAWGEDLSDLSSWIEENLNISSADTATAKWNYRSWSPKLYLVNEEDFFLVKLTYGERIRSLSIIQTFAQLEKP